MHNQASWSISLGRWAGIPVRLHIFFLLFTVFTLYLASQREIADDMHWVAVASLGILLASIVLHEVGHYLMATRYGGDVDEIVIGPLGGLAPIHPPLDPRAECLAHLAGPLANLLVCFICGIVLWFAAPSDLVGLLNPLLPSTLLSSTELWITGVKLVFWINWLLMVVNLLPAFPFDGARALRAGLSSVWPDSSPRRAAFIVATLAKVAAVGLLVVAWLLRDQGADQPIPLWLSLVILAIFLYFGAKQEQERPRDYDSEDDLFGYDFSQGYTSLERSADAEEEQVGPVTRWRERRREARLQRQLEVEREEDSRADEILARLHEKGMDSLTEEERLLLKRVSARYRQRNSNQG